MALTIRDAYDLMHRSCMALAEAEQAGFRLDVDRAITSQKHLTRQIDRLEQNLMTTDLVKAWRAKYGSLMNFAANDQLGYILYEHFGAKQMRVTASGKGATDEAALEEAMEQIDKPEVAQLLKVRKLKKLRDTYLEGFLREQVNGYIHPFYNLHIVVTYRSSSDCPNFQNIPKRNKEAKKATRDILFARPGHLLLEADFSKLEVVIAACYHKDPNMLKYLTSDSSDMHGDLAKQIFFIKNLNLDDPTHDTLRSASKNGFIFPQFYGDYYGNNAAGLCQWAKLSQHPLWKSTEGLEMPDGSTLAEHFAKNGIYGYNDFLEHMKKIEKHFWGVRFAVYQKWKDKWLHAYQKKGYFDTLTGFRCSGVFRKNQVINFPVQGSAFHCLLWSFCKVNEIAKERKWRSRLIGQIHDALIMDVHPDELQEVVEVVKWVTTEALLEEWDWLIVPLQIAIEFGEVDAPWSQMKKWKG